MRVRAERRRGPLKRAGVAETGYPDQITYLSTRGIRVAFLGFAPYGYDSNLLDIPRAVAMVKQAREDAALVVVIIHAGAEGPQYTHVPYRSQYFLGEDRGDARGFAHAVIDAGASLVVGSGPHVIRGVEDYQGHLVAYSLGNFVGYHTLGGGGILNQSAILRVRLGAGGTVLAADWIPILLDSGLPRPDPSDASAVEAGLPVRPLQHPRERCLQAAASRPARLGPGDGEHQGRAVHRAASSTARVNTASSIGSVSLPVNVFC
jgi:hypothetical protein